MYKRKQAAFTIVELLIVIVIIGILAAITIVAYNGITQKAHVTALQSDLSQGATALGMAHASNGLYPADQSSAGLKSSPGDTLTYNASSDGSSYCLQGSGYGFTYVVSNNQTNPILGYCSGTVAVAGTLPTQNGGIVTTLAGSGTNGSANGTGQPHHLVIRMVSQLIPRATFMWPIRTTVLFAKSLPRGL